MENSGTICHHICHYLNVVIYCAIILKCVVLS